MAASETVISSSFIAPTHNGVDWEIALALTVPAGAKQLGVRLPHKSASSISWNGSPLSSRIVSASGNTTTASIWDIDNPASGLHTLSIIGGASSQRVDVYTTDGTDPSTPRGTAASSNNFTQNPSVSVTTLVGDLVVDCVALEATGSLTPTAGQTSELDAGDVAGIRFGASQKQAVGTTTTMSWTGGTASFSALVALPYRSAAGPSISSQPSSQTARQGFTATFTIAATGSGTLHYQWTLNGVNVGTDSDTYVTDYVQPSDDGAVVRCTVTDDNGNVVSDAATLSVVRAPSRRVRVAADV